MLCCPAGSGYARHSIERRPNGLCFAQLYEMYVNGDSLMPSPWSNELVWIAITIITQLKAVFVSDLHFPVLQADGLSGSAVGRSLVIQLPWPYCSVCQQQFWGVVFLTQTAYAINFIKTMIMLLQTVVRDHCKSSASYKAGNVLSM